MDANDIRSEIMTMDFTDQRAVADALVHIAEKLCELEHQLAQRSQGAKE